ncbi:MAG: protein BatD [Anaerolineae bacterium]|nr:protein BatD [Anaerolineae bacterium]
MNKKLKLTLVTALTIIALLIVAMPSFAQASPIQAEVDRNNLTTDESLVLTITVQGIGSNVAQPEIPYLDGLNIVGSSMASQINIVNGNTSASTVYQYRLQPARPGDVKIDPITVVIDGQTFSSDPILIHIEQGSGAAQSQNLGAAAPAADPNHSVEVSTELNGQDLFVEAVVDNATPYQGEAIDYTFRFYQAVNLFRDPNYQPPSFTSFWTDGEPFQTDYTVEAGGRTYRVSEVHHTIIPTANGTVVIEPTVLNIPGSLFEGDQVLQTQPVEVNVQAWPQGAPSDFKGAVGKYNISAKVDATETKVNEPVTLEVVLSGEGNINTAGDPVWTEGDEWRSFEEQANTTSSKQDGKIVGQKVYERLLIPTREGQLTIPEISYSYFDPETAVYETISTGALTVNVLPGAPTTTALGSSAAPIQPEMNSDIRHIKLAPEKSASTTPLTSQTWFWLLWLVPLGLVVGQAVVKRRQNYWANNGDKAKHKKAANNARKCLQEAAKNGQDSYQSAMQIFNQYLEDKLNQSVTGLRRAEIAQLLTDNGIDAALVTDVQQFLETCEHGRFAPTAPDMDETHILAYTGTLIDKLETQFR